MLLSHFLYVPSLDFLYCCLKLSSNKQQGGKYQLETPAIEVVATMMLVPSKKKVENKINDIHGLCILFDK